MIKAKAETRVKVDNSKKIKAALKQVSGSYVTIGIHKDAGEYDDGTDVATVALANEFGVPSKGIPQRSFFRTALEENEGKINAWREEALGNIIEKGWSVQKGLEMLGFRIQILIQNKIKSNVPPPNKASTLKEKQRQGVASKHGQKAGFEGRTGTLIESGLMLRSVGYKVFVK